MNFDRIPRNNDRGLARFVFLAPLAKSAEMSPKFEFAWVFSLAERESRDYLVRDD
jgi:hypothetical protein